MRQSKSFVGRQYGTYDGHQCAWVGQIEVVKFSSVEQNVRCFFRYVGQFDEWVGQCPWLTDILRPDYKATICGDKGTFFSFSHVVVIYLEICTKYHDISTLYKLTIYPRLRILARSCKILHDLERSCQDLANMLILARSRQDVVMILPRFWILARFFQNTSKFLARLKRDNLVIFLPWSWKILPRSHQNHAKILL